VSDGNCDIEFSLGLNSSLITFCRTSQLEVRKCDLDGNSGAFFLSLNVSVTCTGCPAGAEIFPDNSNICGFPSSIALDSNMLPRISYYHITTSNLRLVICQNPNCTSSVVGDLYNGTHDVGSKNDIAVNQQTHMIYVVAYDKDAQVLSSLFLSLFLSCCSVRFIVAERDAVLLLTGGLFLDFSICRGG
jgi:hypothetical protein